MKKRLIKTLITALICGASATTFAAANPFSDVPVTHWAYKAVTDLASAGIIEGYDGNNEDTSLNNKFVGNRVITRYEMAQMVTKALAHVEQNETQLDTALMEELHCLTVEFHDDLKNLGVRVADLEEHSDNVSWHGKIRIWSERTHHDVNPLTGEKDNSSTNNVFLLRLEPSLKINKNWKIRSRIEARAQLREDSTGNLGLKRVWAEGTYGNNIFRAGRMPMGIDMDLLFETQFSGAQFVTGKNLKATFSAGRFDLNNASDYFKYGVNILDDNKADYQALSLQYKDTGKLTGGIAYHHLKSDAFSGMIDYGDKDHANILTANAIYNFDGNVFLRGNYGKNFSADRYRQTYNILIGYKDYDSASKKAGDWGAYVAYRYLAPNISLAPTYVMPAGVKGWEFGIHQTILDNIMLQGRYIVGKDIMNNEKADKIFGRVEMYF